MSLKLLIPCNEDRKEIGIFNHIKALSIPTGVSVLVSFKDTPKDNELYPLSDIIADLDANGEMVENARRCWFHITGTSSEDIEIIASNVTPDGGFIDVKQLQTLALESTTKDAIETLANTLGNMIEPYGLPSFVYAETNSGSQTTLIEKTLSCDKIKVILNVSRDTDTNNRFDGLIFAHIDGKFIASAGENGNGNGNPIQYFELENIRGKVLKIRGCRAGDGNITASFTLQEYTLKT